jgi:hypothetical protein
LLVYEPFAVYSLDESQDMGVDIVEIDGWCGLSTLGCGRMSSLEEIRLVEQLSPFKC